MPNAPNKITILPTDLVAADDAGDAGVSSPKIILEGLAAPRHPSTWKNGSTYGLAHLWASHRTAMIAVVSTVACLVLAAALGTGMLLRGDTGEDWVQRVAKNAEHSVVRVATAQGTGSAFVVASHDGRQLLLTNRHVVQLTEGWLFTTTSLSETCSVVLPSGKVLEGRLVGVPADASIDLALVLVETHDLRPLGIIRHFASINVGDQVVAIGHPLGLEYTVTDGIVSAKRGLLIQTNAAINPGNSGGPLLDRAGRVVGINTSKYDAEGIGFAIRADLLQDSERWRFSTDVSDLLAHIVP